MYAILVGQAPDTWCLSSWLFAGCSNRGCAACTSVGDGATQVQGSGGQDHFHGTQPWWCLLSHCRGKSSGGHHTVLRGRTPIPDQVG